MKLVVGLGNPGKQYEGTRHNMGFIVVDEWAHQHHELFNRQAMKGDYLETRVNNEKVIVVKPTTFMNLSGDCVDSFIRYYKLDIKDVLIIYDDMDLVPGKLRLRPKGSAGGHNGMKDIIKRVGTTDIQRLKVGVGHPDKHSVVSHVLSRFPKELHPTMLEATERAVAAVDEWLMETTFENVMNKYNG
ncbi:MAG: aminoacyl-tRNA hydrolase [Aerococcus sp.]|nr:aminoacyl-tRNA hydrolase [Aerococcus sp.]